MIISHTPAATQQRAYYVYVCYLMRCLRSNEGVVRFTRAPTQEAATLDTIRYDTMRSDPTYFFLPAAPAAFFSSAAAFSSALLGAAHSYGFSYGSGRIGAFSSLPPAHAHQNLPPPSTTGVVSMQVCVRRCMPWSWHGYRRAWYRSGTDAYRHGTDPAQCRHGTYRQHANYAWQGAPGPPQRSDR